MVPDSLGLAISQLNGRLEHLNGHLRCYKTKGRHSNGPLLFPPLPFRSSSPALSTALLFSALLSLAALLTCAAHAREDAWNQQDVNRKCETSIRWMEQILPVTASMYTCARDSVLRMPSPPRPPYSMLVMTNVPPLRMEYILPVNIENGGAGGNP